jgi:hypothetical protein
MADFLANAPCHPVIRYSGSRDQIVAESPRRIGAPHLFCSFFLTLNCCGTARAKNPVSMFDTDPRLHLQQRKSRAIERNTSLSGLLVAYAYAHGYTRSFFSPLQNIWYQKKQNAPQHVHFLRNQLHEDNEA